LSFGFKRSFDASRLYTDLKFDKKKIELCLAKEVFIPLGLHYQEFDKKARGILIPLDATLIRNLIRRLQPWIARGVQR